MENKIAQIHREASRLSEKQSQVEEVKAVLAAVKKEEKQTTHMPYKHPNYNRHFDQWQGQNKHLQKSYVDKQIVRHTKQQLRWPISQNNLIGLIKIDLGWTTTHTLRQFFWGICNSYRLISSSVAKDPEMTVQAKSDIAVNEALRTNLPLRGRQCNKKIILILIYYN